MSGAPDTVASAPGTIGAPTRAALTAPVVNRFGAARQQGMNQLPGLDGGSPGTLMPAGVRASPMSPANFDPQRQQLAALLGRY